MKDDRIQPYSSGLTLKQISKEVGFSHTWLVKKFKELGIETRQKGYNNIGKKLFDEEKLKISIANNPNAQKLTKEFLEQRYVKEIKTAQEIAQEIGVNHSCVFLYIKKYNLPKRTISESLKLRGTMSGEKNTMFGRRGELAPSWDGGISSLQKLVRRSYRFTKWRKEIYKRDGYKCVLCGNENKPFQIDHIKPFSLILRENELQNIEEANKCEELFDVSNGRVLCLKCHKETDTYGIGTKKMIEKMKEEKVITND